MYFEDFDLVRRIGQKYQTVYYPNAHIYHDYERGHITTLVYLGYLYPHLLDILTNGVGSSILTVNL